MDLLSGVEHEEQRTAMAPVISTGTGSDHATEKSVKPTPDTADEETVFLGAGTRLFAWTAAILTVFALLTQVGKRTYWEDPKWDAEDDVKNCRIKQERNARNYSAARFNPATCEKLEEEFARKYNYKPT